MRIIQLIDSLEAGGAERMAVNYANGLTSKADFSGLVCTRREGLLKAQIQSQVNYSFLAKKSAFDHNALWRLRSYCIVNKISHVQAHSTSFFIALLLKFLLPNIKLIYHHHYGLSAHLGKRKSYFLKLSSYFFSGIVVVNQHLKKWAKVNLSCKRVIYLPNFVVVDSLNEVILPLNGIDDKRILCLANLRPEKNHLLLLDIAVMLLQSHPDWTFHLVGQDFNDEYSFKLKKQIIEKSLDKQVFIYGTRPDVAPIIKSCSIGVLTSISEGLPLAVLEYGLYNLPVVVSDVGGISTIVDHKVDGFILPSGAQQLFYESLVELIENQYLRLKFGQALQTKVQQHYSEDSVLSTFSTWCNRL